MTMDPRPIALTPSHRFDGLEMAAPRPVAANTRTTLGFCCFILLTLVLLLRPGRHESGGWNRFRFI